MPRMDRRQFVQGATTGAAALLITESSSCGGKSVETEAAIGQVALGALKALYPNKPIFDQASKLFADFNADWIAGKFDSARTVFDNLDTLITQIINDLEINASPRVKFILITLMGAFRAIAAIIAEQSTPTTAAAARRSAASTVDRVKQLSNPADAAWILKAVQK